MFRLPTPRFFGGLKSVLRPAMPRIKISAAWLVALVWILLLIWIWWKGPTWTLYEQHWLEPLASRWLATAVWGLIALGWVTWRVVKRLQHLEKQQRSLRQEDQDPLSREIHRQQHYLERWLLRLRRHLGSRRYLWHLPWYMVIGPAKSGKTTLLSEGYHSDVIYEPESIRGDAIYRSLITPRVGRQAVVFDIDGALTDSSTNSDDDSLLHRRLREHWLGWLVSQRTRQPLNGLILTLDLPDLLTATKSRREQLLQSLRGQLQEIRQSLHSQLPVYIVLTKLDLLHGFASLFRSLDSKGRDTILGVTFTRNAHENDNWRGELKAFWQSWGERLNLAIPDLMLTQSGTPARSAMFSFARQMQGVNDTLASLLDGLLDGENMDVMLRGVWLTSSLQRGQVDDIFTQSAARQYQLGNSSLATWPLVETTPYFTRSLFRDVLLAEPNLAGENSIWLGSSRRRLAVFSASGAVLAVLAVGGWHHYYNKNWQSGITVLAQAESFMSVPPPQGMDEYGNLQLPLLDPVRDATFAYGDYREHNLLADMGLYQGRRVGPYVEQTYLQLLEQKYLPALFNGLVKDLNNAPPESEKKLAVLRAIRMLEDRSGRNDEVVKQYMARRWSERFHGQRAIQTQLMAHLDYALAHTDWHGKRQAGDSDAISRWVPYDKSVIDAQHELSKLPIYQRVYQTLRTKALGVLPADLNLRDQIGPVFDKVFVSGDDNKLVIPQFLTRYGLQSYFIKQRDSLVELTALDSWVLNLTQNVAYSNTDREEIQRHITEQYISDYTATWRSGMDNLNVHDYEALPDLTDALEQIISGDQPFQRALTALRDNTHALTLSGKLDDKEREAAMADLDYRLLSRLGHEFAPENSTLEEQKDKTSTLQAVYQQLTELHRYLLAIQNAPVPGKSALKAVQLRLDQNNSDPIFATRQMAKTLPAPLNRWIGKLADQAWHVVMVEAIRYMELDWRNNVVKPFNDQLANNYPFNPRASQDASLDAFERFFKPEGILDKFYQENLRLFLENDLTFGEDGKVLIRDDIRQQLETAEKIRNIFFNQQNGPGTQYAVETVTLSANKRRSVLNMDGQLVDYSQGRSYTSHLVWPNNMRQGNESKLTLVSSTGSKSPRSIAFSGPWAQFRLLGAGQLTNVTNDTFDVRFNVDGGYMVYRIHVDTEDNPFSGGLFSQFALPDTLY
ncbi:type VI secretion system membrane subunit TssM [Salmonella enterica]|nr:type VI secretion system membrane subunit TssM [Salmonella enterica]HCM1853078.1 type VI secretion system membrane subunit TssM [Salmonella enterica subsp. salamae serovar 42:z29:-]EAU0241714.1 type VI secretion system membrane subunit TssM [Salmonella enterica]EAX3604118.1 type VI secretion system membrane subunit TssM [Salmonella enterica]EAY8297069.1 type VI secretion system membrane subunit TssM [Salmonella enterica]